MIEAILGREQSTRRLLVKVGGKAFPVGMPNSVPKSVSRTHCKIIIDGRKIKVVNLKPNDNVLYVDGHEVESKSITENSRLQLGEDCYDVDLKYVIAGIRKLGGENPPPPPPAKEYSVLPLKEIWEEYESTRLEMQLAEGKKSNIQKLGGICSSCGILFMFIEGMGNLRFVLTGISIVIALVFFIRGMSSSSSLVLRLSKLDKEFRKRYVCPNEKCKHFVGNIPYDVLRTNTKCPYCGCKYKE